MQHQDFPLPLITTITTCYYLLATLTTHRTKHAVASRLYDDPNVVVFNDNGVPFTVLVLLTYDQPESTSLRTNLPPSIASREEQTEP